MKPITSAGMGFEPRIPGSEETMKVNPRDESNGKVRAVAADSAPPATEPRRPASPDSVRLSGDLRLADDAVRAASVSGGIRPHAVERARELVQCGALGSDLTSLADAIIDSLLETRDQRRP